MSAAYDFQKAPNASACRLLARTIDCDQATAEVRPGFVTNTFILIVSGKKPYLNMTVTLSPVTYIQQPDYWEIQVVGCVPGIVLPAIGAYHESLPLDQIRGTKGIIVKWADDEMKFDL